MEPDNNFAIPQPSTTRSISDGFCKIVYDVRNIVIKRKSIDSHHAIILDRLPKVEQEAYMYRDTCTQVDGRFAGFSPFFLIYPDKRCDVTQAESLIKEMGMDSILHKFSASVCVMNPLGNTYDMEKDLSKMYKDKKQESVNNLKDISAEYPQKPFTAQDVVMDIIMLFVTTAVAFGWTLIMLLIFSFVTLSYVHIEIGMMLLISTVVAVVWFVVDIVKKVVKYRKLRGRE